MKADISTLHKPDILILRRHPDENPLQNRRDGISLGATLWDVHVQRFVPRLPGETE
jgi:hypothetical protein